MEKQLNENDKEVLKDHETRIRVLENGYANIDKSISLIDMQLNTVKESNDRQERSLQRIGDKLDAKVDEIKQLRNQDHLIEPVENMKKLKFESVRTIVVDLTKLIFAAIIAYIAIKK